GEPPLGVVVPRLRRPRHAAPPRSRLSRRGPSSLALSVLNVQNVLNIQQICRTARCRDGGSMTTVRTEQLVKRYGSTVALDGLDLESVEGGCCGSLGPTGAGKPPTLGLLPGSIRPTSGSAPLFGLAARRDARAIHERLAYVPSVANLWPSLTGA